jgi:crotonobetainyl-CoA:carnitine CoA-transferase CaiB-like acyl-CoA transferase
MTETGQRLFTGLTVLDCASFIAAPAAATVLADFGADVIKIEPPSGDPFRHLPQLPGNPKSKHNWAWMLESRNKRGLALDLLDQDGRAVLRRMVGRTDVFITNFPPAVRRRLGITYEELRPLNKRLIYASFTGYGEQGGETNKPGFDTNAWWARSGMMDLVRPDSASPPARSLPGMGDHPSALTLFAAIVAALYRRERTGAGAHVRTSLMANGVWSNALMVQARLCGAAIPKRPPRENTFNALTNHYRCRDGRWLILSLLKEDREWPILLECLGRQDLATHPRFATRVQRHAHAPELTAIFDEAFAGRDLEEWRRILDARSLIFGVVAEVEDVPNDEQMLVNGVLIPFEDNSMMTVNSPIFIDGEEKCAPRRPPDIGQHTDGILRQFGFDDAEIAALRDCGVVT